MGERTGGRVGGAKMHKYIIMWALIVNGNAVFFQAMYTFLE